MGERILCKDCEYEVLFKREVTTYGSKSSSSSVSGELSPSSLPSSTDSPLIGEFGDVSDCTSPPSSDETSPLPFVSGSIMGFESSWPVDENLARL